MRTLDCRGDVSECGKVPLITLFRTQVFILTHFNILHFKTTNLSISLNMLINMIQNAKTYKHIKFFILIPQTNTHINT